MSLEQENEELDKDDEVEEMLKKAMAMSLAQEDN